MSFRRHASACGSILLFLIAAQDALGRQTQPIVTVVADFNDNTVAASIVDVRNVLAGDCFARRASIPARGQGALAVEIGATIPGASLAADLLLRVPLRFDQADRVAAYCWIKSDQVRLGFRIRDAADQVFETPLQTVRTLNRWINVAADLKPSALRRVRGDQPLTWPIQILGFRVETDKVGRQTAYLDDLRVEHRVRRHESIVGSFSFDRPTKIYEPGETVSAIVSLENRSRVKRANVTVELAWIRDDGTKVKTQRRTAINLPPGGNDYRSRQPIDFSLRIVQPGLYRLIARVRSPGWRHSADFETTIAVMHSNRNLSRGRSVFFGLRTNLFREPLTDQKLEIELARQIGVHMLAIETPWVMLQPKPDQVRFDQLDRVVNQIVAQGMAVLIALSDPPPWLDHPRQDFAARQAALIESLARRYGGRARRFQLLSDSRNTVEAMRQARRSAAAVHPDVTVLAPPSSLPGPPAASQPAGVAGDDLPQPVFVTQGDPIAAGVACADYAAANSLTWTSSHWWQHTAAPEPGAGGLSDADAVVRHYAAALTSGVSGLIWFDLRDDDNDPKAPELMRGLVRRDFSPKNSLLGFASAARVFTGMHYAGEVFGAPPECDSACFVGSRRHLALILPKPNRTMPGVLAPFQTAPGSLEVFDYHGNRRALLTSAAPPLLIPTQRPFFVALNLVNPEPEPQLGFAKSWLTIPSRVFLEEQGSFTVEVVAPLRLAGSFLQIESPAGAPWTSNVGVKVLRARAGDKIREEIVLTKTGDGDFQAAHVDVKLDIEGDQIVIPLPVVRQAVVRRVAPNADFAAEELRIATLSGPRRGGTASIDLYAAYTSRTLILTLDVTDDRHLPFDADGSEGRGDELLLGLAREGADDHVELLLIRNGDEARLIPRNGTSGQQLRGWNCRVGEAEGDRRRFIISVSPKALGLKRFEAQTRLLVCAVYHDDDGGLKRDSYRWGEGLGGGGATGGYMWLRLARRRR